MSSAVMRKAVLRATMLATLAYIVSHHLQSNALSPLATAFFDSLLANATDIDWGEENVTVTESKTDSHLTISNFYTAQLPRFILCTLLAEPLSYYWHIWLERALPARQKGIEPMKRRASLSWCYTLTKWMLHLAIGRPLATAIFMLSSNAVGLKSAASDLDSFQEIVFLSYMNTFFSIQPFATLLAFIVVPAHQRIVFLAGMEFLSTAFFGLVLEKLIPWMLRLQFVQEIMRKTTDALLETLRNDTAKSQAASTHKAPEIGDRVLDALEPH